MDLSGFNEFIGNDSVKRHLQTAILHDRISHAYIISGETGMGKRSLARLFARTLFCEEKSGSPCGKCHACKMTAGNNHPDLITVTHEKPTVLSVNEIREQLVSDVGVKPYYGGRKIYLIPDAEKMNVNSQNAILKTIEEPPAYAILILLTSNREVLLPTITSRCVTLELKPLSDSQLKRYLIADRDLSEKDAAAYAAFAHGNIGKAIRISESEDFAERLERTLDFLRHAGEKSSSELFAFAKAEASEKEHLEEIVDVMLLWYRDVLVRKVSGKAASLTFIKETEYIDTRAESTGYEELERVFREIGLMKERLRVNASAETGLDMLLLSMRDGAVSGSSY